VFATGSSDLFVITLEIPCTVVENYKYVGELFIKKEKNRGMIYAEVTHIFYGQVNMSMCKFVIR
jgi:hypothetical protein